VSQTVYIIHKFMITIGISKI